MAVSIDALVADLDLETAVLLDVLRSLTDEQWSWPTPAPGWTVADQVSHLAFFDSMATLSVRDREEFERVRDAGDDDVEARTDTVARAHRHLGPPELYGWTVRART